MRVEHPLTQHAGLTSTQFNAMPSRRSLRIRTKREFSGRTALV